MGELAAVPWVTAVPARLVRGQAPPSGGKSLSSYLMNSSLASCRNSQKITIHTCGIPRGQFAPPEPRRPAIPACIHWVSAPASPSAELSAALLYPASGLPRCLLPFLFAASIINGTEFLAAAVPQDQPLSVAMRRNMSFYRKSKKVTWKQEVISKGTKTSAVYLERRGTICCLSLQVMAGNGLQYVIRWGN